MTLSFVYYFVYTTSLIERNTTSQITVTITLIWKILLHSTSCKPWKNRRYVKQNILNLKRYNHSTTSVIQTVGWQIRLGHKCGPCKTQLVNRSGQTNVCRRRRRQ